MANVFLRSTDGDDLSNGTTWALAKATLLGAIGVMNAGDDLFVSKNHVESTAGSQTYTIPGTADNPSKILCVDDTGDPVNPTVLAETASIGRSGSPGALRLDGFFTCHGVKFTSGSGGPNGIQDIQLPSSAVATAFMRFVKCHFNLASTSSASVVRLGLAGVATGRDMRVELIDCAYEFGAVGASIAPGSGRLLVRGGSIVGATIPNVLVLPPNNQSGAGLCRFVGMDLSAITGTIIDISRGHSGIIDFVRCKLAAGAVKTTGAIPSQGGMVVSFDNCDSGDTNHKMRRESYQGIVLDETTTLRTGGAGDGTTPLAWRMLSSANAKRFSPLESPVMEKWNNEVGSSKTVTVEILHDSLTALLNSEVWLEVEYLGVSGFPQALFAHDGAADILASGANQAVSSVTWADGSLVNPNKQKLEVAFTPQEKGLVRCKVMLAKPSYTVWVDPKPLIS